MTYVPPLHFGFRPCDRCHTLLAAHELACPTCGLLQYRDRLAQLSAQAIACEHAGQRALAAGIWQEALALLPPHSPEARALVQRIALLGFAARPVTPGVGWGEYLDHEEPGPEEPVGPVAPPDSWPRALLKTGGSLLLNIPFYALVFYNFPQTDNPSIARALGFGAGFLLLILTHEMGHVLAMRHYRLSASPPVFLPFIGALINLRQAPPDARVEAVIGIGGPVLGTVGAAACLGVGLITGLDDLLYLSLLGFMINLFNMLPLPPLDGGRVMAAVSPWTWLIGLGLLLVMIVFYGHRAFLLMLILLFALPRVLDTLRDPRRRTGPYYRISRRASWTIGIAYVLLTATLILLFAWTAAATQAFFS